MAYIEPNTTIKLLGNIHIDNSYDNTGYFDSLEAQYNYFSSKTIRTYEANTYQRQNRGTLRVYAYYSDIYYCSYMMFKNSSFENKWFYAFVNKIEYINDSTVEITYEIDVIQTWYFETHFNMCFIEREHVTNDDIGSNLIDEGVEIGDYHTRYIQSIGGDVTDIYVTTTVDIEKSENGYQIVNVASDNNVGNYYQGAKIKHFYTYNVGQNKDKGANTPNYRNSDLQIWLEMINGGNGTQPNGELYDDIDTVEEHEKFYYGWKISPGGRADGVISITMGPPVSFLNSVTAQDITIGYDKETLWSNYDLFGNYEPVNNKLYTFPYSFAYCTTYGGDTVNFPLEYFSTDHLTFKLYGSCSGTPSLLLIPTNYKGASVNMDEAITLSDYPQCAFNIDTYRAWLAQNQNQINANILSGVGESTVGAMNLAMYKGIPKENTRDVGKFASMGAQKTISGVNQIMSAIASKKDHKAMPNQSKGNASGNVAKLNANMTCYGLYMKFIQKEFAQCIDEYFSMFGYQVNRVKMPEIGNRPMWHYIKTIGCDIDGNVPSDVLAQLNQIHDNGVRYWKNLDNVGHYKDNNGKLYSNK